MMLDEIKKRLRSEYYDLSFQEFIKKLNIEEDFKKYEDAYVTEIISSFDRYVAIAVWSDANEEFNNKELVKEAKSNLKNYVISVVNSSTLWGYDRAYNLVPDVSLPIAKMIASRIIGIDVYPEVKNECETGRAVSMTMGLDAIPSNTAVEEYISYLKNLNSKMTDWFRHYLERNTLRCLGDTIVGSSGDWDFFLFITYHALLLILLFIRLLRSQTIL